MAARAALSGKETKRIWPISRTTRETVWAKRGDLEVFRLLVEPLASSAAPPALSALSER